MWHGANITAEIISNTDRLIIPLNKNSTPILFYWDGQQDIYEALETNPDFIDYLMHTVINKDKYTDAWFSFFKYYLDSEDKEHYHEDNKTNLCILLLSDKHLFFVYILHIFQQNSC